MPNDTKILVTGAGGTVGRALADELSRRGRRPRLAYHTPALAEAARAAGRDAVRIDYAAPETLVPALRDVDVVFLLSASGPDQRTHELGVIAAAQAAGVRKIVKLSAWGASRDQHPIARVHGEIERALVRSGIACTLLRPNGFMQNFLRMAGAIRAGTIRLPAADARISHVDVRDVARVAAMACELDAHVGVALELSGPAALTYADAAAVLSRVLERRVAYASVPDDAARTAMLSAGMLEPHVDGMIELYRAYRGGAGEALTSVVQEVTGCASLSFERFVADHRSVLV